jgi:hypothetical protein
MDARAERRAGVAPPANLCEDRHIKDSRVIAAAVAVLVMAIAVATSSAQTAPPIPTPPIPNPPNVHLPGEKSEKFKVILEGKTHADRVIDIGGNASTCAVTLHEDIQENVTFGRGKGVMLQFIRFKEHGKPRFEVQRVGHPGNSFFTVVAQVTRTTQGTDERTPAPPGAPCPSRSDDLSTHADCGHPITSRDNWGIGIKNDHFRPAYASSSLVGPDRCGEAPPDAGFGDEIADITHQWPTPALLPYEPMPLHKIFGRTHAFKIEFKSLDPPPPSRGNLGTPPLTGNYTDHGTTEATLRFIRQ